MFSLVVKVLESLLLGMVTGALAVQEVQTLGLEELVGLCEEENTDV
jgi:hypothetical protein